MKQTLSKLFICTVILTACLWQSPLQACEQTQDEQAQLQIEDVQAQPESLEVVLQETANENEAQQEE